MFLEALSRQDKPELIKCVGFRVTSGEELKPQAVRSQVCLAMSSLLPPAESRRVSSKSWRQIPVTLSLLGGLDPTEVCAMGNWLENPRRGQNVMPWRYHRAKLKQATLIKHQLRYVMKELLLDQACSSWEHADSECIRLSFQRARKAVAAELAEAVEVEYAWRRGSHCMTGEQAFRLRHSSLARLRVSSVEQPAASMRQQKRKRQREVVPARAVSAGNAAIAPDLSPVKPKLILDKRPLTQPLASLAPAVLAPAQGEEPVMTRECDSESQECLFKRVAKNRWVRPGQSCDPEPPTVVARWDPSRSLPVVLLGGPPLQAQAQLFQRHDVKLVISCIRESTADEPRYSRVLLFVTDAGNGKVRVLDLAAGLVSTVATGFLEPKGVLVTADAAMPEVLVADAAGSHVLRIPLPGDLLAAAGAYPWPSGWTPPLASTLDAVPGSVGLSRPSWLGLRTATGDIFVVEASGAMAVHALSLNGTSRVLLTAGPFTGLLPQPRSAAAVASAGAVAVDEFAGTPLLLVADRVAHRLLAAELMRSGRSCSELGWASERHGSARVCGRSAGDPLLLGSRCNFIYSAGVCCSGEVDFAAAEEFCTLQGAVLRFRHL
ncbi:unnamed protein product [Symbiodinium sp. CCMP2592]|nr:unnamed protein product [Symbiodinium sp. CCMP2592]